MISKNHQIKKITKAFMLASLIACTSHAESPQKKKDFTHKFTVGLESFKYHYGETQPNQPNFMQYNGMMYGVNGAYQLTYKDSVFIRPEARVVYGFTTYTNYRNAKYPKNSIPNLIFEPRLLVGGNISLTNNFDLSPYTGLGYRYKSDKGGQVVDDQNERLYDRVSQYWYIPLGSNFTYGFSDRWFVKGFAEYDCFLSGRQFSYDSKKFSPSPVINKQNSGWGAKAELLVGHRFENFSVACGPYISYWKIKKSSVKIFTYFDNQGRDYPRTPGREPDNVTKEIGLKLNFYF